MKRWNVAKSVEIENPKIDAFIAEVIAVSKKHGLSIGHEDSHGAFVVEVFSDSNADWLLHAHDDVCDAR